MLPCFNSGRLQKHHCGSLWLLSEWQQYLQCEQFVFTPMHTISLLFSLAKDSWNRVCLCYRLLWLNSSAGFGIALGWLILPCEKCSFHIFGMFLTSLFEATVTLIRLRPPQEEAVMALADQGSVLISSRFHWDSGEAMRCCFPFQALEGNILVDVDLSINFSVYYLPSLWFPDIISIISISPSLSFCL